MSRNQAVAESADEAMSFPGDASRPSGDGSRNPPEKSFRVGVVSGAIFRHTAELQNGSKRTFRSVVFQKRYRDETGQWQSTSSFNLGDLANLARVVALCQTHLEAIEADTSF